MQYGKASGDTFSVPSGDAAFALTRSKWYYAGKFLVFAIISFILYNTGYKWLGKIINSHYKSDPSSIGVSLVARTSCALAIWFAVHAIIMIGNRNLTDSMQFMLHIMWPWLHSFIFLAIWIAFWFIPDAFFDVYIEIAYWLAGIYLLLQIIVLINFFHDLNDKFATEDNLCVMIAITGVLSLLSIVGYALAYWAFQANGGEAIAVITVSLVVSVASFILAMMIPHGSIFTASLIAVYASYLTFSGLMCSNPLADAATTQGVIFAIVSSIFTLTWMAYSASSASLALSDCPCACCQEETPIFSLSVFHSVFALASVYLLMLVTHWCQGDEGTDARWAVDRGSIAKWINFGASWITQLLYLWTLFAPIVCPDRDFN
jgi:hypothetical protein